MGREELREIAVRGCLEDREIAAVDDVAAPRRELFHQPTEMGVQLGGASGEVDGGDPAPVDRLEAELHRLLRHGLAPIRTRVDVAMAAGLVAELAHVDLKDLDALRPERPDAGGGQRLVDLAGEGERAEEGALRRGAGHRRTGGGERWQEARHHIPIFLATLRIWTPWTSDAPPRIAAATCTASVI